MMGYTDKETLERLLAQKEEELRLIREIIRQRKVISQSDLLGMLQEAIDELDEGQLSSIAAVSSAAVYGTGPMQDTLQRQPIWVACSDECQEEAAIAAISQLLKPSKTKRTKSSPKPTPNPIPSSPTIPNPL